jgi:A/G-specific adenine glycosylase
MRKNFEKNYQQDHFFTNNLMQWHIKVNKRTMPWKGILDPYKIWLSEIILQQTRVEQGWSYYERFIHAFPTIQDLAKADESVVFKLWEGLGYYSRCRNLIHSAKYIVDQLNGQFPNTYQSILSLKGVGPYTAAAIASFAFKLPHAVVDGNVIRVLARYFAYAERPDQTKARKWFDAKAAVLLDKSNPNLFNQAIMDLGATICKPQQPLCTSCPLSSECLALVQQKVEQLPTPKEKLIKKHRFFLYLVINHQNKWYVQKRPKGDIWADLFEFIPLETFENAEEIDQWSNSNDAFNYFGQKPVLQNVSTVFKQELTHQTIRIQFLQLTLKKPWEKSLGFRLVDWEEMKQLAFPRTFTFFMESHKNWFLNI